MEYCLSVWGNCGVGLLDDILDCKSVALDLC